MSNAGKKIRLIKFIAKILSTYESWFEIDFILRQFGMRNSDDWDAQGGKESYVINMVEYADESELEALYQFLVEEREGNVQGQVALTPSVSACWGEAPFRVFISHSSEDKEQVMLLKQVLSFYGVAAFVAHEDIQPTSEWQEEILCGLETCHAVVAWGTQNFVESFWAQQEMGFAMSRRKLIVSVMNGSGPVGFASRQQGIRGLGGERSMPNIVKEILGIFIQKSVYRNEIQEAMIRAFGYSTSFIDAREKLAMLETFSDWDEEKLKRLKLAADSNSQVAGSYGVPERIDGMFKKYLPQPEEEVVLHEMPF